MKKKIEILSGWATGQNSVRLTPRLVLEPSIVPTGAENAAASVGAGLSSKIEELSEKRNVDQVRETKDGRLLEVLDDAVEPNPGSEDKRAAEERGKKDEKQEQRKISHMKQNEVERDTEKEENTNEKGPRVIPEIIDSPIKRGLIEIAKTMKNARPIPPAKNSIEDPALGVAAKKKENDRIKS